MVALGIKSFRRDLSHNLPNLSKVSSRSGLSCNAKSVKRNLRPRQEETYTSHSLGELPVLRLVASCVQVNSDLARFEEVAGRTAMVAFAIAFVLESFSQDGGVFGSYGASDLTRFISAAGLLIISAAVLASQSGKRAGGLKIQQAVMSSLTALHRSASSITQRNVDNAVDYVFEQVFKPQFVDANLLEIDDFI